MRLLFSLMIGIALFSCNNKKNSPDVSAVKVNLSTQHFEEDFFNMDTNHIAQQIDPLLAKYPGFGENFMTRIMGINPVWPPDTISSYLKSFITYYRTVYDTSEKLFKDFSPYEQQIKKGLQFVKYYYPKYPVPSRIITYIGPVDGKADIIGDNEIIIGLHAHLGKDFPLYKTDEVEDTYPEYKTATFTPAYIPVNAMKVIVDDMYPDNTEDKRLIIQMVEKGKRLYLLSKFLPETEEYLLIGYTKQQMKDCYINEPKIWDMFIQNNYLQQADNNMIKNYVTEGPKTQELPEGAPGNIGSFAGWQIVKKYMDKHPDLKPDALMAVDDEKLYGESKYKP